MIWKANQPYKPEWTKIVWEIVPYTRGRGVDLGCGAAKAFPHFIGVDSTKDKDLFGSNLKPDIVCDATRLDLFADRSLDFAFSSHLLEHIDDWRGALREWWRVIRPGGHLVLYLPLKDAYPNVGEEGANPDHKHNFIPADIIEAMKLLGGWDLLRNEERIELDEYSFLQVFRKTGSGVDHRMTYLEPKPAGKRCAVVRYGAWGDGLQATSVLPTIKAQGYHITFYTTPRCYEVIKHNPNIDAWYMQDTDQVPNSHLGMFWEHEAKKYDKFVNLSESVEGTFLAIAGKDTFHERPHSVRAKYLNVNYTEFAHDLAEIPYVKPEIRFHATLEERNWAAEQKDLLNGRPTILWVLAGSSVHKIWPHVDQVLARLMLEMPQSRVITVGDEKCRLIEDTKPDGKTPGALLDWDRVPCIAKRSGRWSIRETLAFAQVSDLVIGPETGVLSAVSMEKMPKIVFLSHSSHNNLTRDWINTFALFSQKTPCYPCHQLHYTWKYCHENKIIPGVSDCQYDIPPEACWIAINKALKGSTLKQVKR